MKLRKSSKIKGRTRPTPAPVSQASQPVTQAATQPGTRCESPRPRRPRRAGPYLIRRGRIFYFRKRLPRGESNPLSNLFLVLSLRTDLPLIAVTRSAALLTVCEQKEKDIVDALTKNILTPAEAKALLTEMLRAELERILALQRGMDMIPDAALAARIAAL
ncbi:hypothetical protein R5H32_11210 [Defluviimonas sp. D31]|uniref:hypothetical protein n=1 Tax=Defluviimonas sp. D31 TaxID=3083253 RepID=UPI00296E919A|nr:hypothetical protein [Defluviimonas sp. D31]MDW4549922.1 hypothetical protein [Defluviimonas sp. D31]